MMPLTLVDVDEDNIIKKIGGKHDCAESISEDSCRLQEKEKQETKNCL